MTKASEKSSFWRNKEYDREIIKDLMAGVDTVRRKYLIKNNAENESKFQKRQAQAQLSPLVETQINGLVGKGLASGISVNSQNDFINSLNKNFDGFNRTIFDFSRDFYKLAETYSEAYAFVDFEQLEIDEDGNLVNTENLRAYVVILDLDSILHTRDNGKECTYLRFKEYKTISNGYDDKEVIYIKEFKKEKGSVYWSLIEIIDGNEIIIVENQKYFLNYIPIIELYPNGSKKMFDVSLFWKNCANLNMGHFNAYSHYLNLSKVNSIPVMLVKAVGKQAGDTIEFGAGTAVCTDSKDGSIQFVEPSGAGLQGSLETVKKFENDINFFGLNVNTGNSGNPTATASAIEEATVNSMLSARMISLKNAIDKIVKIIIEWESFKNSSLLNAEYTIEINTEFNTKGDQLALQALLNAYDRQAISKKTLTDVLIKLGFLDKDFDFEKDAELIENAISGLNLINNAE